MSMRAFIICIYAKCPLDCQSSVLTSERPDPMTESALHSFQKIPTLHLSVAPKRKVKIRLDVFATLTVVRANNFHLYPHIHKWFSTFNPFLSPLPL